MKRSTSKLQIRKASMNHIGTTPYKFKIEVFVSYIDHVKHAADVCVTWERRGKTQATKTVEVKDDKAILRETLSMESTLFRRNTKDKGKKGQAETEQLKFDEKKVKFVLRKGGPDGKGIGKISMNIAEYVRGVTSTVFADLKLSNGSVIVTKIEATMLHMGKNSRKGSTAGSETYSEMSEANSLETDSLFGDEEDDKGDLGPLSTMSFPTKVEPRVSSSKISMSPTSTTSNSSTGTSPVRRDSTTKSALGEETGSKCDTSPKRTMSLGASRLSPQKDDDLKQSPSLRQKLKHKIKEKTNRKKSEEDDAESSVTQQGTRKQKTMRATANEAEVVELRRLVESLKEENAKLRRSKQAAMDEIDALRSDLEACENALEQEREGGDVKNKSKCSDENTCTPDELRRKISELNAQNQSLIDELEELHEEGVQSQAGDKGLKDTVTSLRKKIQDLEVALRREPQFLDVVNELKVTKVSLALANMEKEQAIFAMQTLRQELGVDDSE